MKIFALTVFFLVSILIAQAQEITLRGRVVTNKKDVYVPFATVKLYADSTLLSQNITDSMGAFLLKKVLDKKRIDSSKFYVQASFLEYNSDKILVEQTSQYIEIEIKDSKHMLQGLLVNTIKPMITRSADRFIFVPDKTISIGASGLDIMRHAPMIQYDPKSEAFSIINKSNITILINNKKSIIPKEVIIEMLRSLPADNIKSIEIITNPGSEYDAGLAGGIININVKKMLNEGWLGVLSLFQSQSVYDITRFSGSVNYHKDRLTIQLLPFLNRDYNYSKVENRFEYTTGDYREILSRSFRRYYVAGGAVGIDYDINDKNFLSFKGSLNQVWGKSFRESQTTFFKSSSQYDSLLQSPLYGKDYYLYNFGNLNFRHNIDVKGSRYVDFNIDYNQFVQENRYNGIFEHLGPDGKPVRDADVYENFLPQHFVNFSQRIEYVNNLNSSNKIVVGLQNSHTQVTNNLTYYNWNTGSTAFLVDNNLSNDYRYKELYHAAYVSYTGKISSEISLVGAIRAEHTSYVSEELKNKYSIDTNYLNFFPSLALNYAKKSSANRLSLSFSRKISRPNIEMLFPGRVYYNEQYFKENNPFLQPVLYTNAELVYSIKGKYNFTLGYMAAKNQYGGFLLPISENGVDKIKSTFVNYGKAQALSATLSVAKAFMKKVLQTQTSLTFNLNRYKSDIAEVPLDIDNFSVSFWQSNSYTLSKKKAILAFTTFSFTSRNRDISGVTLKNLSSLDLGIRKTYNNKFSISLLANDVYNGRSIVSRSIVVNGALKDNREVRNNYTWSFSVRLRYIFGNTKVMKNKDRSVANDEIRQRA